MKVRSLSARCVVILALLLTVASTVMMSGAICVFQVYRAGERFQTARLQGISHTVLVSVADAANAPDERKAAVWAQLGRQFPNLLAVTLLDGTGDVLFSRGDVGLLRESLQDAASATAFRRLQASSSSSVNSQPRSVSIGILPVPEATGPVPGGTLLVATEDRAALLFGKRDASITFLLLLIVGAGGVLLGGSVLSRHLLTPLREMSDRVNRAMQSGDAAALPVDRDDEIGRLARAFRQVQGGLDEWRERATRLERTMDRRVNAETQRINAELKRVERKAWTDPLTGLANRRLFDDKFPDVFAAQQRRGHDLSVVMIDIDYFKNLNDSLGHAAGDEILRFIGELLCQCLRGNDLAIRLGGDEFMLILPSASAADAACVAQRTVRLFAQRAKLLEMSPRPSMSAGVASIWESHAATPDQLARCADEALYRAKRLGKGRVATHSGAAPVAGQA